MLSVAPNFVFTHFSFFPMINGHLYKRMALLAHSLFSPKYHCLYYTVIELC